MKLPDRPRIYHITHVDNIDSILVDGGLLSDAAMVARGGPATAIGMSTIKLRRLQLLQVTCHSGDFVGEYVPFFFCPRSIMLFMIHCANHRELTYHGGQGPIVHLEADMRESVAWAEACGRRWAFSLSNAGARYTAFRNSLDDLGDVDWAAVRNNDFRSEQVKEGKQAEFLMHETFPWSLVRRIGVHSASIERRVVHALRAQAHRPPVAVRPDWYF